MPRDFSFLNKSTVGMIIKTQNFLPSSLSCRGGEGALFELLVGATVGSGRGAAYLAIAKETGGLQNIYTTHTHNGHSIIVSRLIIIIHSLYVHMRARVAIIRAYNYAGRRALC